MSAGCSMRWRGSAECRRRRDSRNGRLGIQIAHETETIVREIISRASNCSEVRRVVLRDRLDIEIEMRHVVLRAAIFDQRPAENPILESKRRNRWIAVQIVVYAPGSSTVMWTSMRLPPSIIRKRSTTCNCVVCGVRKLSTNVLSCLFVLVAWTSWRAPQPAAATVSIAVLPFANLSGDASQDFFSDGIAEEVNTALARFPISASSRAPPRFSSGTRTATCLPSQCAQRHASRGRDGPTLGTRVRITAQLVKADGVNIWAASYDRELTDVFAIQEGIAEAIAGALQVPLGLNRMNGLPRIVPLIRRPTTSISAAGSPFARVAGKKLSCSNRWSPAIPTSRPGGRCSLKRAGKCRSTSNAWAKTQSGRRSWRVLKRRHGKPSSSRRVCRRLFGPCSSGQQSGKWVEAIDLFKRGLARNPEDPELLNNYPRHYLRLGYLKEALEVRERVYARTPGPTL